MVVDGKLWDILYNGNVTANSPVRSGWTVGILGNQPGSFLIAVPGRSV